MSRRAELARRAIADSQVPPEKEASGGRPAPAQMAGEIRKSLDTIRKAWPLLHDPTAAASAGIRTVPGSKPPTPIDPLSLIAEITRDLTFWTTSVLEAHPVVGAERADHEGLQLGDPMGCARWLAASVDWISSWEPYGNRCAMELLEHAEEARRIAWPRRPAMLLGECPRHVARDGHRETCGTKLRYHAELDGQVKCLGCGHIDTIDGWLLAIVGDEKPVSIPQLVPLLKRRLGVVITPRTLQRWHRDGLLPAPVDGSDGKPLFDRRDIYPTVLALTGREGA